MYLLKYLFMENLLFDVIALVFFAIVFCWAFGKLLKSIFNLRAINRAKKYHYAEPRTCGMVLNKKTQKLEADSRLILPFE